VPVVRRLRAARGLHRPGVQRVDRGVRASPRGRRRPGRGRCGRTGRPEWPGVGRMLAGGGRARGRARDPARRHGRRCCRGVHRARNASPTLRHAALRSSPCTCSSTLWDVHVCVVHHAPTLAVCAFCAELVGGEGASRLHVCHLSASGMSSWRIGHRGRAGGGHRDGVADRRGIGGKSGSSLATFTRRGASCGSRAWTGSQKPLRVRRRAKAYLSDGRKAIGTECAVHVHRGVPTLNLWIPGPLRVEIGVLARCVDCVGLRIRLVAPWIGYPPGFWRDASAPSSPSAMCVVTLAAVLLVYFTFDVLLKRHGAEFVRVGYCSLLQLQRGSWACASAHLLAFSLCFASMLICGRVRCATAASRGWSGFVFQCRDVESGLLA